MRLEKHAFPHQLDTLARELMLHADRSGRLSTRSLSRWGDLAEAFNAINYFGNAVFDAKKDGGVMLTLHRLAHQQFPRFSELTTSKIGRYLALYRSPALSSLFEKKIGIDVDSYFVMAFAVIAASMQRPEMNTGTDFSILGINESISSRFFDRIVGSTHQIREKLIEDQRLSDCWEYTFNALHFKPLVALDSLHPEQVVCPLPPNLERRLMEGIYYDVFQRGNGFERAYGEAVENLVGRLLSSLPDHYACGKPEPYKIGKEQFAGADWILSSGGDIAFVECKSKRMAMRARTAETVADLHSELQHLADAVVQNYANINRATNGSTINPSVPGSTFCVVVTLEDWLLFSPIAVSILNDQVGKGLQDRGMDEDLIKRTPFRIMGVETLQYCVGAMRSHTMSDVLGGLDLPQFKGWLPGTYLHNRFPDVETSSIGGFDAEFENLFNKILQGAEMRESQLSTSN